MGGTCEGTEVASHLSTHSTPPSTLAEKLKGYNKQPGVHTQRYAHKYTPHTLGSSFAPHEKQDRKRHGVAAIKTTVVFKDNS